MLIIILEYTCNMVVHIHSKYTFINPNTPNYTPYNSKNTPLYIHRVATKLVTLQLMGYKLFFLDENQTKCCSHVRMNIKIVSN
jgi:hypothetical protein